MNWTTHQPEETLQLYDIKEDPLNHNWIFWIKEWCRWLVSQPKDTNPANDKTGMDTDNANSGKNSNPRVYYLAGATSGKFERICHVTNGKAIFFPVVVDEESTAELPSLENNPEKLTTKCIEDQDNIVSLEAILDKGTAHEVALLTGTLVKNRKKTDIFDLDFPADNLWDATPTKGKPAKAMADGYWLFIKPPKPGKHTIHFHAVEDDFEIEVAHYLEIA
jgi:hypothetical protein